ncbi:uncharacterized protein P884DRAFT_317963 [Thermothelomyces heterothallicus CBS 202.75]|uniref:uncharacterized protein n=1 Tax=Thermothelomyces heterothallicus CBS 202.75 TaxID=1149848 RepID=UPI0037423DA1
MRCYHAHAASSPNQNNDRLSQMRRFNPVWLIRSSANGRVICDVKLHNHVIEADSDFDCTQAAKIAVAKKALSVVQSWPVGCFPPPPSQQISEPPRSANAPPPRTVDTGASRAAHGRGRSLLALNQEGGFQTMAPGLGRSAARATELDRGRRENTMTAARGDRGREQVELLEHVRRVMGISMPDTTRDNPEAARAFLEGLAVGARLAGARVSGFSLKSRSRSPLRSSPETYRARSPLGRSGRLSPPPGHRWRVSDGSPRNRSEPRPPRPPVGRGDRWVHDRYYPGDFE